MSLFMRFYIWMMIMSIWLVGINCISLFHYLFFFCTIHFQPTVNEGFWLCAHVMRLQISVFPERRYERDGKVTTMVVMELAHCRQGSLFSLFFICMSYSFKILLVFRYSVFNYILGEYMDELRKFLDGEGNVQVVVVVQLAKVKTFRDLHFFVIN